MPPKPGEQRRTGSAPPDSLPPQAEPMPDDLRREDQGRIPADLPQATDEIADDGATTHTLAPDGGAPDHPIHDDDPGDDYSSRDYEEQIEEAAESRRDQRRRASADEA